MPVHVTTTTTQSLSNKTFVGPTRFDSDVTIFGNLSCSGTQTFNNTVFSTTSAVSVVHVGSGPALWVGNNGTGDIASFYDIDQNVEVFHIGGNNSTFPNVGVKTSAPNVDFTVNGSISASSIIYSLSGNSNQWNSTYSTVQSNSASWNPAGSYLLLAGGTLYGDLTVDYGLGAGASLLRPYDLIVNAGDNSASLSYSSLSFSRGGDDPASVNVVPFLGTAGTYLTITLPAVDGNLITDASTWPNANPIGWFDAMFYRDGAANTIAQRNGASAQTFRVYNKFTSASIYERGFNRWNSNVFQVGTEKLGTGMSARALGFVTDGTERLNIGTTGAITTTNSVSTTNVMYASGGNSNQWNSSYTTVQSNSATWGSGGGGGGSSTKETITQVGHGFAAKDAIKFASGVYAKAQADSSANAEVVGIVESVAGDNFVLVYGGRISSLSGLSAGEAYFLDATTAGALTITSPTGTNISKPLLIATSTSSGVVVNMRGSVGGAGSSTSALNYTYLGAFTATAAALVAADNIFNDTLYDSYIWELSATPATNNVNLIVYLRNATPANAATVAKTGGYYSGIATGAGTTSVAGSLNTAMVNTKPCSFRGTLIFESATNNYGFFQGLSPQVADTYSLNYGYAFSDTTLRQGIAFGYSAGNVASANLKVWGRKR